MMMRDEEEKQREEWSNSFVILLKFPNSFGISPLKLFS